MTNPIRNGEWRLYLRDHKWWWKWPLVATTTAVWLGAMVLFVAPWQSNNSIDLSQPETVSTAEDDENTTVGVLEALDDDFAPDELPEVDDVDVAALGADEPEETEPPADTEVAPDTAAPDDVEADEPEPTESTSERRRRPTSADRVEEPQPETTTTVTVPPATSPPVIVVPNRPPVIVVADRPSTTTTTVRPTTTPPPTTTQPPTTAPPTTAPPTTAPPTTAPPATTPVVPPASSSGRRRRRPDRLRCGRSTGIGHLTAGSTTNTVGAMSDADE